MVSHRKRDVLRGNEPVHVTVRLIDRLPSLRRSGTISALKAVFAAGCDRFGFRLVHWSVQSNHIHMLVEAADNGSLSRGMQGLMVRIAKALNRLWARKGKVFSDRYHAHILRTPREVRNALI
jgi:REP element-mobilizing transposase RayT